MNRGFGSSDRSASGPIRSTELTGVFRLSSDLAGNPGSLPESAGRILENSLPLAFAAGRTRHSVAAAARTKRLACWPASLPASFQRSGSGGDYQTVPAPLRRGWELYGGIFRRAIGLVYFLCAVFPARSPSTGGFPGSNGWPWLWIGECRRMTAPMSRGPSLLCRDSSAPGCRPVSTSASRSVSALGLVSNGRQLFRRLETRIAPQDRVIFCIVAA